MIPTEGVTGKPVALFLFIFAASAERAITATPTVGEHRQDLSTSAARSSGLPLLKLALTLLALSLLSEGQPASTADSHNQHPKRAVVQKVSPTPIQEPSPQVQSKGNNQQTQDCNCSQITAAPIPPSEPKESFSALTLFLFGSALAMFVALLGWSDQIRGINKDTKELENRFLAETGIEKRDFLSVAKPKLQGEQLAALTRLLTSGRIQSHTKVDLLATFREWNRQWSRLETLSARKYLLAVALTLALFIAGIISLFTHPSDKIGLHFFTVRTEMLVLTVPMALVGVLLCIIIHASRRESALRALLESIEDEV